jgi:hypothetical protein
MSLEVTSTAAEPGLYRIVDRDDGHHAACVVVEIDGSHLELERRLLRAFVAGSPLRSFRLSIGVDQAWQRTQARRIELGGVGLSAVRVHWRYYVDGVETIDTTDVDLVFESRSETVTPQLVERRFPGWTERVAQVARTASMLDEAHALVRRDARLADVPLNNAADTRELVELRAAIVEMEQRVLYGLLPAADLDEAEARYRSRAEQLWTALRARGVVGEAAPDNLVDQLTQWFHRARMSEARQLAKFREDWLPLLVTRADCRAAAALIMKRITSSRLRQARDKLVYELMLRR